MIGAGLGQTTQGCLTPREREVAEAVCQATLPQVRGLGQTEEQLITLDLATRFPGVHACDLLGMPACIPRLRTVSPTTGTATVRFFDITPYGEEVPVAEEEMPLEEYEELEGRDRSAYVVGGVVLLLALAGGGYALYRARKKKR